MSVYAGRYGPEGLEYPNGSHAIGRPVRVLSEDGLTTTSLYADRSRVGTLPNPLVTDSLGNISFFAEPGNYICEIDGYQFAITVNEDPDEPATASESSIFMMTASALSGHSLVVPNDTGLVGYGDPTNINHSNRPVWLTTDAWVSGVIATLRVGGIVTEPSWNWTPGLPIWFGLNGQLTQTIPPEAVFIRRVAEVVEPTIIEFRPNQPIVRN